MIVIQARNVCDAYVQGIGMLMSRGIGEITRAGPVLAMESPVTTVYARPRERVLFDWRRDANPFFHLMESIWMLAGERDARWLDRYVKNFSSRYAEEDGMAHGAYGHRWRRHFDMEGGGAPGLPDQLITAGRMLLEDPTTRRAVISMWDPVADLGADKKDVPCNTQIHLRARRDHLDKVWLLDVTVLCRSNDAIWGAYGANAVHMSIMAEVLAGLAGMELGIYRQVSNNFHVYTDVLHKIGAPMAQQDHYALGKAQALRMISLSPSAPDERQVMSQMAHALLDDATTMVADIADDRALNPRNYRTDWFSRVAVPVAQAHRTRSAEDVDKIAASDWRYACAAWIQRRQRA